MIRYIFIFLLLFTGGVYAQDSAIPSYDEAQQGLRYMNDKELDEGDACADTVAPQQKGINLRDKPLNLPHRNSSVIGAWAMGAVVASLSFEHDQIGKTLSSVQPYYNRRGWDAYQNYIEKAGLQNRLQTNRINVTAFSTESPFMIEELERNCRYFWLFEIPIQMSYYKTSVARRKTARADYTQNLTAFTWVGRVADNGGEEGVEIYSFDIRNAP